MKLIAQTPCLNEEEPLPRVLAELPREVFGFDRVEWLVIDDGSTDRTVEVARRHGVDHLVRLTANQGLAAAFQAGLDAALKLGADVIVNTDADGQYSASDIPRLVEPIVARRADMVVGDRQVQTVGHFSPSKKLLQRLGSWVVRRASDTDVPDATSGFRAYNREAALGLTVVSTFTYTLESLIQAGKSLVAVDHVAVGTNGKARESRLFKSMSSYVGRNVVAIFRIYTGYEPLKVFSWIAALADLIASHRIVTQRTLERVRRIELELGVAPSHYQPGDSRPSGDDGGAGDQPPRGQRDAIRSYTSTRPRAQASQE